MTLASVRPYGPTMTDPGDLEAVALDVARTELGVEVQLQAVAANALDVRALVVFSAASSVGGLAAGLAGPLTGLAALLAGAAAVVALGGMIAAIVTFVPRVTSTVTPAAFKRLEPGQTAAGLHARAYDRRTEDHRRSAELLRIKADRLKSAFTLSVTAAGLLLVAGVLGVLL